MTSASPSRARPFLVLLGLVALVVAAIALVRSRAGPQLSIEDKVNISALANRICKAGGAGACPIEWIGQGKGGGRLAGRTGQPVASLAQARATLPPPQWIESPGPGWAFRNGRYAVTLAPDTGIIVIAPH